MALPRGDVLATQWDGWYPWPEWGWLWFGFCTSSILPYFWFRLLFPSAQSFWCQLRSGGSPAVPHPSP